MMPTSPSSRSRRLSALRALRSGTTSTLPAAAPRGDELEQLARLDLLDRRQRAQAARGEENTERLEVADVRGDDSDGRPTAQHALERRPLGHRDDLVDVAPGRSAARGAARRSSGRGCGTPSAPARRRRGRGSVARWPRRRGPGWRTRAGDVAARIDATRRHPNRPAAYAARDGRAETMRSAISSPRRSSISRRAGSSPRRAGPRRGPPARERGRHRSVARPGGTCTTAGILGETPPSASASACVARYSSAGSVLAQWMVGRPRATNRSSAVRLQATGIIGRRSWRPGSRGRAAGWSPRRTVRPARRRRR